MSDTLSIRKTLILGLGTTGKEVAEAVAEHLTWQFGGFEKAAWVRLLVLETEQPTSLLGRSCAARRHQSRRVRFVSETRRGRRALHSTFSSGRMRRASRRSTIPPPGRATCGCWGVSACFTRPPLPKPRPTIG